MNLSFDKERFLAAVQRVKRYILPASLLFMVAIYGFLAFRIYSLDQTQPDQSEVASKLKTAGVPHIDEDALAKIQQLQDNSVDVQTLFDQARSNPFEE